MSYCLPLAAIDTAVFPGSYAAGRQRWLAQLNKLSCHTQCLPYACPGSGPESEELVTDTVWIGPEDASKVLVLLGGTHGIEGFAGSAIQTDQLGLIGVGLSVIPADTAVLMVHALTPWGYAWQRRCDADGVDLNRNAVDFSGPLPENKDYDLLKDALYLPGAAQREIALAEFERRHGRVALEKAVSAGQYSDPSGPFYGGKAPAHGRLVCEDLIRKYALQQRDLSVIDLHTGLGSYGYGEIICDHQPDSAGTRIARSLYGESVALPLLGTSSSVPKTGLLDYAWHAIMNERSCYITLEFGTFSTDRLFETLLRDHQLWAQPGNEPARLEHSKAMRRHFCPDDRGWREMVLFRARQVIAQGLHGVAS
ncbi:MAG: M14 family metallopeptidase [Methylobacter tundripaludum]|nr:M14 family metallopeptidase [Methylobacter tundripaludum]